MSKKVIREIKLVAASLAAASLTLGILLVPSAVHATDFAAMAVETSSSQTIAASDYDGAFATAPMPDLKVTVSQTDNLTSQGIVVSWTGGKNSIRPSNGGGENFMQIFQCWGEDPNHPGRPDRTTCQYGGYGAPASARVGQSEVSQLNSRDLQYTKISDSGALKPYTSIPFKSATGETIWDLSRDQNGKIVYASKFVSMDTNQFYSSYTTNEIDWAGSDSSGAGSSKFEVQTAAESPGLGCGNQQKANGKVIGQPCWLVVLPRGTHDNGRKDISSSGLFWDAWQHAIAFKMGFTPIGFHCQIGVAEQQVQGSELVNQAFSSWQPSLCGGSVKQSFVLSNAYDGDAIQAAATSTQEPILSVTTGAADGVDDGNMIYSATAVAGVSVSFAIDRILTQSVHVPDDVAARSGRAFEKLKLTPTLLAKLLTSSYKSSIPVGVSSSYLKNNPQDLIADPEFKSVNSDQGDWKYMSISGTSVSDALMPSSRSLLAQLVWKYIMADKNAAAFMSGKPDHWGMVVNPWYSTSSKVNPTGAGLILPAVTFPKSDPVEKPDTSSQANGSGAINLVTWRPYLPDFTTGAADVLRGQSLILGGWNPVSTPPAYGKPGKNSPGTQATIGLTVTPAAKLYQNIQVSLLNPAGKFVAPDQKSLEAAERAMTTSAKNSQIVEFDFQSSQAKAAQDAYPLTAPIYVGVNTKISDSSKLVSFANMLDFITKAGQISGESRGQLPAGYAPLDSQLLSQARASIAKIRAAASSAGSDLVPVPVPEPSQKPEKVVGAGITPRDPSIVPSSLTVPYASVIFICALTFYVLLRRRKVT